MEKVTILDEVVAGLLQHAKAWIDDKRLDANDSVQLAEYFAYVSAQGIAALYSYPRGEEFTEEDMSILEKQSHRLHVSTGALIYLMRETRGVNEEGTPRRVNKDFDTSYEKQKEAVNRIIRELRAYKK